jgi:ABC-type oligopeptide transport system substrate-binding subunit
MKRKLITGLITMATAMYVFPFAVCATSAITGLLYSFKPCDVFNCVNPSYFDPCEVINCSEGIRSVPTISTTSTSSQ